jgi:hypothetical protein
MQQRFGFGLAASIGLLAGSVAVAQTEPCRVSATSIVDRSNSVIVEKVTLAGAWGSTVATVFQPDKPVAQGAVVFSHSEIDQDGRESVDLLPLALTLAQAGAAVIVPERALKWLPTDRTMNREGAVVLCATHWIVDHTNIVNDGKPTTNEEGVLVRWGFAYVGPRLCDPNDSECRLTMPFHDERQPGSQHHRVSVWVPVGETEGGDNTSGIISDGGLRNAKWLQRSLGLAPIQSLVSSSVTASRF